MPEYFSRKNWNGFEVNVNPTGWRKLPLLKSLLPVYVGNKFKFKIEIKRSDSATISAKELVVYEHRPGDNVQNHPLTHYSPDGKQLEAVIESHEIMSRLGEAEYRLGTVRRSSYYVIVSTPVVYKEIGARERLLVVFGIVLGFVIAFLKDLL